MRKPALIHRVIAIAFCFLRGRPYPSRLTVPQDTAGENHRTEYTLDHHGTASERGFVIVVAVGGAVHSEWRNENHDLSSATTTRSDQTSTSGSWRPIMVGGAAGIVQAPATVMRATRSGGDVTRESHRSSEPTASMSRSMFPRLPAMVISSTGKAISPPSIQSPAAPRE